LDRLPLVNEVELLAVGVCFHTENNLLRIWLVLLCNKEFLMKVLANSIELNKANLRLSVEGVTLFFDQTYEACDLL